MPEQSPLQPRDGDLLPIQEISQRFGLKSSTLRYYEKRGLLEPTAVQGGRRWYGPPEIRRIAVIMFWQRSGLMSLNVIGELLDGSSTGRLWQETVARHIEDLHQRIEQLQQIEAFISQSLACPHHESMDECPDYEELIWHAVEMPPVTTSPVIAPSPHPGGAT